MEKTESGTGLFILLAFLQGLHGGVCLEVKPSVNPAQVGDNVVFDVSPPMLIKFGTWSIGSKLLVMWVGTEEQSRDSRASVNTSTGTLSLNSVTVNDSGVYTLKVLEPPLEAQATLTVLEPVSNVTVNVSVSDPVELNDTVRLMCSACGSSLSFKWLNGSSDITERERIELTDDNRTLTISNVSRFDRGPFYCFVSNGIGKEKSLPQYLNISYGPDGMIFWINGSQDRTFPTGSNLTLSCSAQSSPPALFQWDFNGKLQKRNSSVLELMDVQEEQSGNYTCWAYNSRTLRYNSLTEAVTIRSHSELVRPTIPAVALLSFLLVMFFQ